MFSKLFENNLHWYIKQPHSNVDETHWITKYLHRNVIISHWVDDKLHQTVKFSHCFNEYLHWIVDNSHCIINDHHRVIEYIHQNIGRYHRAIDYLHWVIENSHWAINSNIQKPEQQIPTNTTFGIWDLGNWDLFVVWKFGFDIFQKVSEIGTSQSVQCRSIRAGRKSIIRHAYHPFNKHCYVLSFKYRLVKTWRFGLSDSAPKDQLNINFNDDKSQGFSFGVVLKCIQRLNEEFLCSITPCSILLHPRDFPGYRLICCRNGDQVTPVARPFSCKSICRSVSSGK